MMEQQSDSSALPKVATTTDSIIDLRSLRSITALGHPKSWPSMPTAVLKQPAQSREVVFTPTPFDQGILGEGVIADSGRKT